MREERIAFVERAESDLRLTMQTELLSLNHSSLYYQLRQPSVEDVRLKHRIDEIYTQLPYYRSRKIATQLQRDGRGSIGKQWRAICRKWVSQLATPGINTLFHVL